MNGDIISPVYEGSVDIVVVSCRKRPPPCISMVSARWLKIRWMDWSQIWNTHCEWWCPELINFPRSWVTGQSQRLALELMVCVVVDTGDICCREWQHILISSKIYLPGRFLSSNWPVFQLEAAQWSTIWQEHSLIMSSFMVGTYGHGLGMLWYDSSTHRPLHKMAEN